MTYDWSVFIKKININADQDVLYRMFASMRGMESWFLRSCQFTGGDILPDTLVSAGTPYIWKWHGYSDDVTESGKVLEANGTDVFGFSFDGNGAAPGMAVNVTIEKMKDNCLVSLKQFNIPTNEEGKSRYHVGCSEGWTFYLANLKSIAEGGIDLRNRDLANKGVINS